MRKKYKKRTIKDRVATDDNIYILEEIENGKTKLIHTPGYVSQQGTKLNAELLNHVDEFLETLTDEEGNLMDRNEKVAVKSDVAEAMNKTKEVNDRLDIRLNETNRDIVSLSKRLDSVADGVPSLAILQVRSNDISLTPSEEIVPNWTVLRASSPSLLNLVENKLEVYQEGLVTFNTTVEISEPRERDTILTLNLSHNGIIHQRDILIPQGDEHIVRSLHLEFLNLNNYETKLVLESNNPLKINYIESLVNFNFIGEMNTVNINLTDNNLEAGTNSGITNQFDLNRQNLENINELQAKVVTNQTWAETQINHLSTTRPANGHSANFNNLSANNLFVAGNISGENLLEQPRRFTHTFTSSSALQSHIFNGIPGGVRMFYLVFRHNGGAQEHFALMPNFRANTSFPQRICELRENAITSTNYSRLIFNVSSLLYTYDDNNGSFRVEIRLGGSFRQTAWLTRETANFAITCELIAI